MVVVSRARETFPQECPDPGPPEGPHNVPAKGKADPTRIGLRVVSVRTSMRERRTGRNVGGLLWVIIGLTSVASVSGVSSISTLQATPSSCTVATSGAAERRGERDDKKGV